MAGCEDEADAMWEDIPRKLVKVLETESLPIVVKVCEGIYSGSEGFTFSNGDLIKVDRVATVDKVLARVGKRPELNQMNEYKAVGAQFMVPLDYQGKVGLVPNMGKGEVVTLVNDLKKFKPKWVRVLQETTYWYQNQEFKLCRNDKLRVFDFGGNLMRCRRNKEVLFVPTTVNGQFEVPCDPTEYTVREVLELNDLPQVIYFLPHEQCLVSESLTEGLSNMDIFSGEVVLESMIRERLAVGHFKGMGEDSARFARRSVIILPLDDPTVSELEVLCPHYSDDTDYEMFQMQHFSQSSGRPELDTGALYMQFSKREVRFLEYKEPKPEDLPPPRPPRGSTTPLRPPRSPAAQPKEGNADYLVPCESPPAKKGETTPAPSGAHLHTAVSFTMADFGRMDGAPSQKGSGSKMMKGLMKVKKLFRPRPSSTSSDTESLSSLSTSVDQDIESKEEDLDEDCHDYDEPIEWEEGRFEAGLSPQIPKSPVPVVKVTPFTQTSTSSPSRPVKIQTDEKNFPSLSVDGVCRVLKECKLLKLAKIAKEENLDGSFLSDLTSEQLKAEPYTLSGFECDKLEKIKEGWRPKLT